MARRKPFIVIYENYHMSDCIPCSSFKEAKTKLKRCYKTWIDEEMLFWDDEDNPTEKEIKKWNYMIWNCGCHIEKYDPSTKEYYNYYYLTDEELTELGWIEWSS